MSCNSSDIVFTEKPSLFRSLVCNSQDMIYRKSLLNKHYEYVNSASVEITGYTPKNFAEDPHLFSRFIHPDWREYYEKHWAELLLGNMPSFYEYQIIHGKTGEARWLLQSNTLVFDESGKPIAIEGIVRDITERKVAAKELQETSYRFKELFDNMSSGVAIYKAVNKGEDFLFIDFNKAGEKIEKVKREELIGKLVTEVFPGIEKYGFLDVLKRVSETGKTEIFPIAFYKDNRIEGWRENRVFRLPSGEIVAVYDDLTLQKQIETDLKNSNLRLKKYFEQSLVGMAITSVGKEWINVNDAICRIFGYSKEEFSSLTWEEMTHPDDLEADLIEFKKILSGESDSYSLEKRFFRKDNSILYTNLSVNAIRKPDGTIDCFFALINDITEQKLAKIALKENERYYRTLLHSLREDIIVINRDYEIVDVNTTFISDTGFAREEIIGKKCYEINFRRKVPCNTSGEFACNLQDVFRTGEATTSKHIHTRANGTQVVVDVLLSPLKDTDGNVTHVVEAMRDVTKMDEAQKEHNRLVTAIEQSADTIVITDIDAKILYANPAFEHITGYTISEAIGQNPRILQSGEHDKAFYEEMWKELTSGNTWVGKFINKKKDGTFYTEEVTITPVLDDRGNTINYVAVKRDITEKLNLEKQYRQAQKEESIGRLAGGVAHDLNNLLTPILGYSELLLNNFVIGDSRKDSVDEILHAGLRARDLVRQLLAFSRRQTLEYKLVNINTIINGLEKLIRRTIREDITINIALSSELPNTMADIGQIEQVLINMAVNASDAMPQGGQLTIETDTIYLNEEFVSLHNEIECGLYVLLKITDTGCGFDEEVHKHIFEPFYSTKGEQGTGLGLATVYGIVKQHKGCVDVFSKLNHGTTFKVYLPVSKVDFSSVKPENATSLLTLGGNETILLVEDEKSVRELTEVLLKQLGYLVFSVSNGREALSLIDSFDRELDLLITDIVMPDINGKELSENINRIIPSIKVLFMSGYTSDVINKHGVLDEDIVFIQKPFTVRNLAIKVREALKSKNVG